MENMRFLIPDQFQWDEETLTQEYGKVTFQPLERGYGVTIGNSLRRVLLTSILGDSVTSVKIDGVLHENTAIPGIKEDAMDIVINLKSLVVRSLVEEPQTLILDVDREGVVTAADFQANSMVTVINPDLEIATLSPGAKLQMELTVGRGRGYVPADENKPAHQIIGVLPIDAIYTPVRRVKYLVENTRVEQRTDYEKLTLEIWTNGSVSPQDALGEAASLLIKHFRVFVQSTDSSEIEDVAPTMDEKVPTESAIGGTQHPLLDKSIEELELSVRAYNCLKAANIKTIRELIIYSEDELLKFRNFGKKSLNEIKEILEKMDLFLGMKIINGQPVKRDSNDSI